MSAIARKPEEAFESYRKRRKRDEEKTRKKLAGRLVWCSAVLALDEDKSELPFKVIYKKVAVDGTFDRSKGCKLHGSQAEKNKYDSMMDRLKRKGVI